MPFGFRERVFARLLSLAAPAHDRQIASRKRDLLRGVSGTVVELGPGTGVNFPYYPSGIRWIGIEPNRHLHAPLRRAGAGFDIDIRELASEQLPLADASADAVVATLVLCSVDDPARVLREIRRVMKPGARFYFVEHTGGARGSKLRLWQDRAQPAWSWIAGGCRPNRETLPAIQDAGFERVEAEEFALPMGLFKPHIAGFAVR